MLTFKTNFSRLQLILFIFSITFGFTFLTSFIDKAPLLSSFGTSSVVLAFILTPGLVIGLFILKLKNIIPALLMGSSFIISLIIPIHALLSLYNLSFLLPITIFTATLYILFKNKNELINLVERVKVSFNIEIFILIFLLIFYAILLFRQSLYIPSTNLDNFLVWPDTYNALAQAAEISNHGPQIFPFVADAQVPLKYHWGAFSLGSFISFFGYFELVVALFKTQFVLIGLLYFGLLYFVGLNFGKSWLSGVFAMVFGGLTIYPSFPELNEQIGLSRSLISSTSMPQFTANLFTLFALFIIFSKFNPKIKFVGIFFATLTATLSKGPVGLLILLFIIVYLSINIKNYLRFNFLYLFIPSSIGFIIGYYFITSSTSESNKSGTSLWYNPKDTLSLLTDSYGLIFSTKTIIVFLSLFLFSFLYLFLIGFEVIRNKVFFKFIPFIITSFAGVIGMLIFEAWGDSQLFLLYSVVPYISILLSSFIFYDEKKLNLNKLFLILLGIAVQPLIFNLLVSFIFRSQVLKLYILWIASINTVIIIGVIFALLQKQKIMTTVIIITAGVGTFSGLNKFDPIAYSLPEHPYSVSSGTYEIGKYLKSVSNKNDLVATNRHCAGVSETQACTARQFALSAISERRVFLEGWSYTTCPLSEPITNKYWKENSWKLNQDFFNNPNNTNWNLFQKTGVKWLVVDNLRPNAKNYDEYAELVKSVGNVSLWKITSPSKEIISVRVKPCDPNSNFSINNK